MLILLKLGGSLITDKQIPESARHDVIKRLAAEIAQALRENSKLKLILGNGAGSFGHVPAKQYGTRRGARTSEEWSGFAQVADAAARLSRLVAAALLEEGVPVWTIQPSASLRCTDGVVVDGPVETVALALQRGLVPLVHGDVALDSVRGATIASTEEIFELLMAQIGDYLPNESTWRLERMVLAGEVDGIYSEDPLRNPTATRFNSLTPARITQIQKGLAGSHGVDVTGGMVAKVDQSVSFVEKYPGLAIFVCSGLTPGLVGQALQMNEPSKLTQDGTWIHAA
ncbi:MAG: isopentenyl phosphate kinase [Chloroflexota bacterium]